VAGHRRRVATRVLTVCPLGARMTLVDASGNAAMAVGSGVVMAAAMAPSAVFAIRLQRQLGVGYGGAAGFAAGYLALWTGLGAAAMFTVTALPASNQIAVAAPIALAAAIYQGSPFARRFLLRCRSPLGMLLSNWRPGVRGAVRLGSVYALWCAGCCGGLVVGVLALGMDGPAGMLLMGGVVLAEKRTLAGVTLSKVAAVAVAVAVVFSIT
jgi:predicted metal-binding membrane protein